MPNKMIGVIGRLEKTFCETVKYHKNGMLLTYMGSTFGEIYKFEDMPKENCVMLINIIRTLDNRSTEYLEYISDIKNTYILYKPKEKDEKNLSEICQTHNERIILKTDNRDIVEKLGCFYIKNITRSFSILEINSIVRDVKLKCISLSNIHKIWGDNYFPLKYLVEKCLQFSIGIFIDESHSTNSKTLSFIYRLMKL